MKQILLAIAFSTISLSTARAITADELAKYLGVSSWKTTVALPSESFIVELYRIKDGSVGERLFEGIPAWSKSPEKGLQVMAGSEDGKYKIVIAYGSGNTLTTGTNVSTFDGTLSPSLPDTIQAGDYILFGKPKRDGTTIMSENISSYSDGFLLRIVNKG